MNSPKVIGITGGIGSGKSVVSHLLEMMGIPVYDSDKEAKRITANSPKIKEKLINRFGTSLYKDNVLDKKCLASILFTDPSALTFVNTLIHPEVFKDFNRWKTRFKDKTFVGIESAILLESKAQSFIDICITVSAPETIRIEQAAIRDKVKEEAIVQRMNNQLSEEERNKRADYIIFNDNIQAMIPQIEKLLTHLNVQEFV